MRKPSFLVIIAMVPFVAQGLEVEPKIARFGEKILLKGEGYREKERVRILSDEKVFMATATAGGSFTFSFTPQFGGRRVITVKGMEKEETAVFWIRPKIKISPASGSRGTVITVKGEGYGSKEQVQIGFHNNYRPKFVETTPGGTFSTTFIVEKQRGGTDFFYAVGTKYYLDDQKDFYMKPDLKVIPSETTCASFITISGTGFSSSPDGISPGESILIDFGSALSVAKTHTDYFGSFDLPFLLPKEKGGLFLVRARGESSGLVASSSLTIKPEVREIPSSCFAGKTIRIDGDGFLPNEKIKIVWEDVTGSRTTKEFFADQMGIMDIEYPVDSQPGGVAKIIIFSDRFQTRKEIRIEPYLEVRELFPKAEGGTITLRGTGFGIEEEVRIDLGSHLYIAKPVTDKRGSFALSFYLPQISGEQRIVVSGRKSYATVVKYIEVK